MLGAGQVDVSGRRLEVRCAGADGMDMNRMFARREAGKLQVDQDPLRALPELGFADDLTFRIRELGHRSGTRFVRQRRSRQQYCARQQEEHLPEHHPTPVAIAST